MAMSALIAKQLISFEEMRKAMNNFKKDSKVRKTIIYCRKKLLLANNLYESCKDTHTKVLDSLLGTEEEQKHPYFSEGLFGEFEQLYTEFSSDLEELIDSESKEYSQNPFEAESHSRPGDFSDVKLPRITLPNFDGDYQMWTSFKDMFTSLIHNKLNLSNVQKLHYLKSSLSGEAEAILRSYATTDANYPIAWSLLLKRYENKRALLNIQFKKFFNQPIVQDTAAGIRKLLDTTTEAIKAIENLHITDVWDAVIAYTTIHKFPADTRQQWECHTGDHNEIPTFKEISEFLEGRFRALESISADRPHTRGPGGARNIMQSLHAYPSQPCPICAASHAIGQCPEFLSKTHADRVDLTKRNGLCLNCLRKGHRIAGCPSNKMCTICQRRHHSLLHRNDSDRPSKGSPSNVNATPFQPQTANSANVLNTLVHKEVILATALVRIENATGESCVFRALLDQGSQASFVTDHVVQTLALPQKSASVKILGIGSSGGLQARGRTNFEIQTNDKKLRVEAYILHRIANHVPSYRCLNRTYDSFTNLELADPSFTKSGKIDILLGAEIYSKIILDGIIRNSVGLIAQNTVLGWIVSGELLSGSNKEIKSFTGQVQEVDNISQQLQQFWEIENMASSKFVNKEDEMCEVLYVQNTIRRPDGRYVTRLPFKENGSKTYLGSSKNQAIASFIALERRLERNPNLKTEYAKCIHEYLTLGHMREVDDRYTSNYLPHHAVCKESTTTKMRVVFDASRKTTSGLSLNDILLTGPAILNNMYGVLLRWRLYPFAFASDIEKMYRQIYVHPEDAELQRIIWRDNRNEEFKEFALTTVTFGTTCAPYLAIRTLKKLADDERDNFPLAFEIINNEFYVDDLLSGGYTREEAIEKINETSTALQSAGFRLRKWIANDEKLLENILPEDREMQPSLDLNLDKGIKTLGLVWHPQSDEFTYKFNMTSTQTTNSKRQLLSDIARLFDPIGWIAPIIVTAKLLMKSLWLQGKDWDEPLPEDIATQWRNFKSDLEALHSLRIPRWVGNCPCWKDCNHVELHGFCDASKNAYAAAIYLVFRNDSAPITKLMMSKTKVAPVKELTVPKLELSGAQLLAKTIRKFKDDLKIDKMKTYLWSDSTTVISWVKSNPSLWNVFVANRVTNIHELVGNTTWRYVPSKENPADVASRGLSPKLIGNNQLWWKGPVWLTGPKENWPIIPQDKGNSCNEELRKKPVIANFTLTPIDEEKEKLLTKYSSLTRLLRVTAYCFRFIALIKTKCKFEPVLTTQELEHALQFWIKYIQQKTFSGDIENIKNKMELCKRSKLTKMNPIVGEDGILRVGGRLQNAELSFDNTHPIILPKQGPLTTLLIRKYHLITLHGGIQLTLNTIRSKFWIIDARRLVSQFIHRCIVCHKQKAKTNLQLMGNLPSPRVIPSSPFTNTGVDYCGPIDIRIGKGRGFKTTKGYVAVFICLAVKAIHLELVSDLSTQAFLAAFRRFVGRRGICRNIYSDCGTNFVGANTELQKIAKRNRKSTEEFSNEGISWHFNPPASPHFGGLWEAGVKSVKYHLRRMAGNACLTYEELATVLVRIEACLNSRPLCPLTDDPSDFNVLTPGHFLIGDSLLAAPEDDLLEVKESRLDRWQLIQRISQTFWHRWRSEYLTRLQQRPKWTEKYSNLCTGDLVLIKDEKLPPYKWSLGRIVECHPGSDGLVRVVTVRTKGSIFKRPITKIAPLPITQLD